jgi:thiol-disulfide isomerase/thioredoxin
MAPLAPGSAAPPIGGIELGREPVALFFYKVTCPVCQMTAPQAAVLATAYPGHLHGVGQDPDPRLEQFAGEYGGSAFDSRADLPPYDASNAYGIETVPTLFVVDGEGTIVETVESWDREGYNRASKTLAGLLGEPYVEVSNPGDGLPPFRPG